MEILVWPEQQFKILSIHTRRTHSHTHSQRRETLENTINNNNFSSLFEYFN